MFVRHAPSIADGMMEPNKYVYVRVIIIVIVVMGSWLIGGGGCSVGGGGEVRASIIFVRE